MIDQARWSASRSQEHIGEVSCRPLYTDLTKQMPFPAEIRFRTLGTVFANVENGIGGLIARHRPIFAIIVEEDEQLCLRDGRKLGFQA
jgi:hypothetical protein